MLNSPERDPRVEFVADQLKRVDWITGYTYVEGQGYRLDWSSQGSHRMILLQIALKDSPNGIHELDRLRTEDAEAKKAITDFWDACVAQLSLSGQENSIPAFTTIIESWRPRSGSPG